MRYESVGLEILSPFLLQSYNSFFVFGALLSLENLKQSVWLSL